MSPAIAVDQRVQQLNWDAWLEFATQAGHLSEQNIVEIVEHERNFDRYETLPRQLELLDAAGFERTDCIWRHLSYAVFLAQA